MVLVLALALGLGGDTAGRGQQPPIVQPGPPGQEGRRISAAEAADLSKLTFTEADVEFMQGMISHHAQAVEMVELLETRTESEAMRQLGARIAISQEDEIRMMRDWLEARGQDVPAEHAHHAEGAPLMPGMLTPEEMSALAAARGTEFDRLFLQYMIKHHDGALTMVKELFAAPGAAQDSAIFAFASDVDADQRMEMDRMFLMLKELQR